ERAFLGASVAHERELGLGRRRRRRWIMGGFAAAALVATIFGVVAVQRSRVADDRAREATAAAWAASARSVLDEDPELSVLLAIEALEIAPDSTAAMSALNEAMQAHRTIFAVQHNEPRSSSGSISPDGTLLATVYDERKLEMWQVGDRSAPLWDAEVPEGRAIDAALFTNDGDQLVVFDGQPLSFDPDVARDPVVFTIYDARTGEVDDTVTVDDPCIAPAHVGAGTWNGFLDLALPMVTLRTPRGPESGLCVFTSPETDVVAIDMLTGEIEDVAVFQGGLLEFGTPTVNDALVAVGPGAVYDRATGDAILELPLGPATLSADGSRVLAGFNPMMLLDVATGATLREYPGDYDTVYFSSSEEYIVAAGFDGATKVFETGTGWQRFELRGPGSRDLLAQMTADERLVATFSGDGSTRVWDIGSQLIGTASTVSFDTDRTDDFIPRASVVTTPDYVLMPIGNNGTRRTAIFDITDGTLLRTILGRVVAVSPDGATAILQSWSGPVELADYPGLSFREVGGFEIVDLPSGDVVAELSGPCTWHNNVDVEVYGPGCGDYPDPWAEWVMTGSVSSDGTLFAMGGASGYVAVWDITTGEVVYFLDSLPGGNQIPNGYAIVEFSPSGDELVTHRSDPVGGVELRRVNTDTWEVEAEMTDLTSTLSELAYTPDGSLLIAGTWGSDVLVIDVESWTVISTLEGQQGALLDVAVSPDGQLAVTGAVNGVAWMWDLETETVVGTFEF
ncbi:MAG: WD40 repeat domain-containing protein, partial [Actinomycetia bacterium]|nr:WD40 repeat domain-containing protein [Actinomycetes bacterium]